MKLYSRFHVVLWSVISTVIASVVTVFAVDAFHRFQETEQAKTTARSIQTSPEGVVKSAPIPIDTLDDYGADERTNIAVYEALNEGVVNISTQVLAYNWFLDAVPQSGGTGSGSIIDKKGYVLTNNHVVADAVKVMLTLADGAQFEGEIVGKDVENDLAVVKFDPKGRDLVTIPLGTSKNLRVGQKVLAIGNPFALDRTLTTGIVSALGRPLKSDNGIVLHQLIQTDASINPGNSGGPLLNSRGQIIGINTMIFSPSGGSVGIGFAVPVDTARRVVPELIQYGKVIRGWIDISPVQLFPQLVRYARLPVQKGILVSKVREGGEAQRAGIRGGDTSQGVRYGNGIIYLGGDIIVAINGQEVGALADMYSALESTKPGDRVKVSVVRGSAKRELTLTLVQRKDNEQPE